MKKITLAAAFSLGMLAMFLIMGSGKPADKEKYILEREKDIMTEQAGPHNGGGKTTAFPFFSKVNDLDFVLRKRILHPGSSIGYHLQERDEIYYITEGEGKMYMNGDSFTVARGDAILTRGGSSHGLRPLHDADLTLIISYIPAK